MDLAVIVVSYNTRALLAEALASVFEGLERSRLKGEVWVVENASTDGSAQMVREHFASARLVAHDRNVGFAAGNNVALSAIDLDTAALPRYVLFLNPDTRVLGDALGEMVRFLDTNPHAGGAGARLLHADGTFQHSAFAFPGLAQLFIDFFPFHPRLVNSRLNGRYPQRLYDARRPFPVDHPLGAAFMVRARVLAEVGGFDERFFMYCEEIDLARRIRAAGWEIYCVPAAEIVHHVGQSTRQFRDEMFVALWRSRFFMFEKHESRLFRLLARWIVRAGLWAEGRRVSAARRRGEISDEEVARRLDAYREVTAL